MDTGQGNIATSRAPGTAAATAKNWGGVPRQPVDEQVDALLTALSCNEVLTEVLRRAATMDLPGWYATGGCVFQTVWNVVTDRTPTYGIKDYDLFYCDTSDLSWGAEDKVIRHAAQVFADLPADVEVRNQARVHLWYEERFGFSCPAYSSTEDGIDSFGATTCCIGVRLRSDRRMRVYAPHGLADTFNLLLRPNPVLFTRELYEAKASRWRATWPELTVLDWPATSR